MVRIKKLFLRYLKEQGSLHITAYSTSLLRKPVNLTIFMEKFKQTFQDLDNDQKENPVHGQLTEENATAYVKTKTTESQEIVTILEETEEEMVIAMEDVVTETVEEYVKTFQ